MKKAAIYIIAIIVLSSCERQIFFKDYASSDPFVNFEYLWNEVDKKYSYFELKEIDWDEIGDIYREKLYKDMGEEELFQVLADMLNELKDDHTNLVSPFRISMYNLPLQHKDNFNQRTVEEFYIPQFRVTGAFIHDFLPEQNIGYIRYSSFMGFFMESELDYVLNRYMNSRGIILDLRENGGGSVFLVPELLERFTYFNVEAGFFITRNGIGRNDFSEPEAFRINAHDGVRFIKPVMVLIDRGSYSATTMFALAAKEFPNITLIGDTTGGGGGLPNGGQLPNGWTYRFSVSQLLDVNGNNYAESGVPPHINADFDWTDLTKDEIIERAIEEILAK